MDNEFRAASCKGSERISFTLNALFGFVPALVFLTILAIAGCSLHYETPLLRGLSIEGFKEKSPLVVYNNKNIFDYMNGAADIYLDAGFRLLYTQVYSKKSTRALMTVEAFDMKTSTAAQKVFEIFKKEGGTAINDLGEAGWKSEWIVFFRRGHYLYRIIPFYSGQSKAKTEPKDLLELGRAMDKGISSSEAGGSG